MGVVITLRRHESISIKSSQKHCVMVRVTDRSFPEATRWDVQRPVQNAGGFRALAGFDDPCARGGRWHSFYVGHQLVSRFVRQIEPYAARGLVDVKIDGRAMRLTSKRARGA